MQAGRSRHSGLARTRGGTETQRETHTRPSPAAVPCTSAHVFGIWNAQRVVLVRRHRGEVRPVLDVLMNHVFLAPVRVFLLAPFAPEISDLLRSERIPGREGKTRVAARTHNARACSLALALVLSIPLPFSRPRSPPSAHAHTDRWRVRAVCLNSYLLRLVRHIPLEGPHFALLERTLDVEDAGLRERHIALHVSGVQGAWAMTMLAAAPGGRRRARWLCPCRRPTRRARQAAAPTPRAASSACLLPPTLALSSLGSWTKPDLPRTLSSWQVCIHKFQCMAVLAQG